MTLIHESSQRSETERALARYRLLSEHASDIMLFVRPDGRITEANRAALECYGYTREEMLGLTVFDLRDPAEHGLVTRQLGQAAAGGVSFETLHRRKDGSTFPVEVNSQSADIAGERMIFSVVRDIGERRRAERALRESEERFRTVANATPALIWISDADNRCTWFNQPWLAFTGRSLEEEAGFGWMAGVHPEDLERYTRADQDAFERRVGITQEVRLRRHDGEYRWILERGEPIWGPDGEFAGFAGSCVDITDRKRVESRRTLLLEISRLALESPEAGPALTTAIFEKIREPLEADACFNYRLEEGGLRLETCVGVPDPLVASAKRLELNQAFCGTVAASCAPIMADAGRIETDPKGGFVRGIEATAYACHPLFDGRGRVLGTFSVASRRRTAFSADDVDFLQTICHFLALAWERREATAALRRNEAQLRLALAASQAGIWTWDIVSGGHTWSAENYLLYGYDPARGPATYADWEARIHPDDLARTAQAVRDAVDGRAPDYRAEFRIVHPERGVRWLMAIGRVDRAPDGTPLRLSGINLDITERRETEARLQQAQRVQSVGRLAGGIAHEVNNLMTVVLGFGNFAIDQLEPGHTARGEIEQMIRAGERAAVITRQLLAFTRQQVLRPARLDLNAVITDLIPMLERVLGAEHRLTLRLGQRLGTVAVDRGQLEQVLVNLALNSRDAMGTGGTVTIATDAADLEADAAWLHPGTELRRGRYLLLSVSDTGSGMDEATRSRVFEPFFTTKPVGQGTGLGLSTVYGIVKQSGGYVWLYSEPGLGTTAKVYLPMLPEAESAPGAPGTAVRARGAEGEVILVAEDEPLVRSLARRSLEMHGYRVLEAGDGRAALELLEQVGGVDLVVSDAVMPNISGRTLGEIVAARWPGLPVLYTSGYPGKEVVDRGLVNPDAPFLAKPFTPEALARRVREVLDLARR
jgi:two-component system cell cycle sensor histidine kinase/response regulator CckA